MSLTFGCAALQGHPDIINAAAWSPNGRLIATACDDMQLRLFDVSALASQNIKFKWVKTPQAALGVGFGNDGSSLVAALRGARAAAGPCVKDCRPYFKTMQQMQYSIVLMGAPPPCAHAFHACCLVLAALLHCLQTAG
jgi:hypothetical protein